ncbi:TolB family protein, partial [Planctomycetota bacterium]
MLVDECTLKIEANPEDAESYHRRAYYYHNLHDREHALTDMNTYLSLVHGSDLTNAHERWFRDFLIALWQSTPTNLGPSVNSSHHEAVSCFSTDGLSLYFDSNRFGGHGFFDIWMAKRSTTSEHWSTPVNLGSPINTKYWDGIPNLTADGLSLFIISERPGGYGKSDIWVSTRNTKRDPWNAPINLGPTVNSASFEWTLCISADGLELFFTSSRQGGQGGADIWFTTRTTREDDWHTPINLGPIVNSPYEEFTLSISTCGLILFITSNRSGGYGDRDIWVTTRSTTKELWSEP